MTEALIHTLATFQVDAAGYRTEVDLGYPALKFMNRNQMRQLKKSMRAAAESMEWLWRQEQDKLKEMAKRNGQPWPLAGQRGREFIKMVTANAVAHQVGLPLPHPELVKPAEGADV